MALPQPGFVGPQAGDVRQQSIGNLSQGFGAATQARQFRQGLNEEQRQFDVRNRIDQYKQVVDSQYGGDWAAFYRGPEMGVGPDGMPRYAGNEMAKQMFTDLYGQQGEGLYADALTQTPQTLRQMTATELDRIYRTGGDQGQGQAPQQPQPQQQQPAPPQAQVNLPQGAYAQLMQQQGNAAPTGTPVSVQGVAPLAPGTTTVPGEDGLPALYNPMAGKAVYNNHAGETVTTVDRDFNRTQGEWERGGRGDPIVTTREEKPVRTAGGDKALVEMYSPPGTPGTSTEATLTNPYGDPVAPGQEQSAFPLNSETFKSMDIRLKPADVTGDYDTALATGLGDWAYEATLERTNDPAVANRAKELLALGTAKLNKLSPEEQERYDQDAQRIFGVDREGLRSMRMLVWANNENGKEAGYIPDDIEQKEWVVQNVEDEQKAGSVIAALDDPNSASDEAKKSAVSTLSDDVTALTRANLDNSDQLTGLLKSFNDLATENGATLSSMKYRERVSVSFGVPENSFTSVFEAVEGAQNATSPETVSESFSPRDKRLFGRISDKVAGAVKTATRKADKSPEAKTPEGGYSLASGIAMTRARGNEIYDEVSRYVREGAGALSPEVLASLPDELVKARAFEEQLGLENRRMDMEELKTDAYIKSLAADTAYKNLMLDFEKKKLDAQGEEVDNTGFENMVTLFELTQPIYQTYMDNIITTYASNPELIPAALQTLRDNDSVFASAEQTQASILGALTGAEVKEGAPGKVYTDKDAASWPIIGPLLKAFGASKKVAPGAVAPPVLFQTTPPSSIPASNVGPSREQSAADANVNNVTSKYE